MNNRPFMPLAALLAASALLPAAQPSPPSPAPDTGRPDSYPPSPVIAGLSLDWSTHQRRAMGSDNWQLAWADDDHLYGAWGDGGGFGGSNEDGRVGLGYARIEGDWRDYRGFNVWGGKDAEHPAQFSGKSYGTICVDGVLYSWIVPDQPDVGGPRDHYRYIELARSTDHGAHWAKADWRWQREDGVVMPTFLVHGKNNEGSRDNFVYSYFIRPQHTNLTQATFGLQVHQPGGLYLARVPKERIFTGRESYEWFTGLHAGQPTWGLLSARTPVFEHAAGTGWCLSASYHPGLRRHLLATEHTVSHASVLGLWDAPEPWGPWTTVRLWTQGDRFGAQRPGSSWDWEANVFFCAFAPKWLSADGRSFTLVFTGGGGGKNNDSLNTVRGTFQLRDDPPQAPQGRSGVLGQRVRLSGGSLGDDGGPFLGLGASYFQALRHAKYDPARLNSNLALLSTNGFNYVRVLSMVNWDGLEIAPVTFTNRVGHRVQAWPDYWQHFRNLLDQATRHGLRTEVTVYADAQYVMPDRSARLAHLDGILASIAGREHQVIHLEVANEAWQNGFPATQGVADLRTFARYLAERTDVLVAITSNDDTSDQGIISLYQGSAADLATVHFSRDTRTREGGWLPVRDCYRAGRLSGVPPVSSNEPIGPGSSVSSESDPIKLCAAAAFAFIANLPAYVFHSSAGVYARDRFEDTPGIGAFRHLRLILPADLASWERNDGLESHAPFTAFCNGQSNTYWPEVTGATNGCHRNIGSAKDREFVCFPMGILADGVTLEARRSLRFEVLNPLTGLAVSNLALTAGQRIALPQGPGAYLLKGSFE